MAVPTITSVSPNVGLAQGQTLVRIVGTGFSEFGVVVKVNGVAALRSDYISDTEVHFVSPRNPVGTYAVRVDNLDEDRALISGEFVVAASAYTHKRPDLDSIHKSVYSRITAAWIRLIRNDLIPNVSQPKSTDFDPELNLRASFVDVAKFPAMTLFGPTPRPSRLGPGRVPPKYTDSTTGRVVRRRSRHRKDLYFTFVVGEESNQENASLQAAMQAWFDDNAYLEVNKSPTDAGAGSVRFPFRLEGELEPLGALNGSNKRFFRGSFSIMGVTVEDAPGAQDSSVDLETGSTTSMSLTFEEQ
jgi:hypothetical protein